MQSITFINQNILVSKEILKIIDFDLLKSEES